jgi:hypothetical protein
MPMAFEPPPTQATTRSGKRFSASRICARVSLPITVWKSRTICGIGMRAGRRADDVERVVHIGDPVAQRLVHRILQRARAGRHGPHFGAQQIHAEHIGLLPLDIDFAHIDDAGKTEARGDRGRRHAVLARARLRDDARLAHAAREQDLARGNC